MTEAEWLACDDPEAMLEWLGLNASERKLRLLAVAGCRTCELVWADTLLVRALDAAEQLADGVGTLGQFEDLATEIWGRWSE